DRKPAQQFITDALALRDLDNALADFRAAGPDDFANCTDAIRPCIADAFYFQRLDVGPTEPSRLIAAEFEKCVARRRGNPRRGDRSAVVAQFILLKIKIKLECATRSPDRAKWRRTAETRRYRR